MKPILPFASRAFRRRLLAAVVLLAGLATLPTFLPEPFRYGNGSARFYFLPVTHKVQTGQEVTVELRVAAKQNINAVGTVLRFDQNALEILQMTTDRSPCTFYTENSFDMIKGEVRLFCGAPHPGFTGDSVVVRLIVRPRLQGDTTITLDPEESMVLADNGRGTDTLAKPLPSLTLPVLTSF